MTSQLLLRALVFILGASFGSFIGVLIYRIHHGELPLVKGRSQCPTCRKPIQARDLIPLLSFLLLRGKCRSCSKEISYMYPLLEFITGLFFIVLYIRFPFVDAGWIFHETQAFLFGLHALYATVFIFTFFYDLKYMHVVDAVLLPTIAIALIATLAHPLTPHIFDALGGGFIAVIFFSAQILISRGKWLGAGDIRVGALMGVVLGIKLTIVALFFAYIIGSLLAVIIFIQRKKIRGIAVPFAPLLVIGTYIAFFFGDEIAGWYLGTLF